VFISITCPHHWDTAQDGRTDASDQTPTESSSSKVLPFWTDWVDTMLRLLTPGPSTMANNKGKSTPIHKVEMQARCALLPVACCCKRLWGIMLTGADWCC
jgi:hypothetical protein